MVRLISLSTIAILLFLNLTALVFEGLILKIILEPFNIKLLSKEWFGLNVLSSLGNMVLPFGGWGVRGLYLKKKYNFSSANFLSVLTVVTIFELIIFSLGGLVGLIYLGSADLIAQTLLLIFSIVTFICLIFILITFKFKPSQNSFLNRLAQISQSWQWLKNQKQILVKIILLMIGYFLVSALIFLFAFQTFGFAINYLSTFIPTCLSNYTLIIRLLPASIGFYEGAVIYTSRLFNFNVSQGLLVAEIVRVSYLFWLLVLAPIFSYILLKNNKRI